MKIDSGKETTFINFGPQHPACHGTLHIEMELDGETVVQMSPNMGFLHTGMEKFAEHRNYNQYTCVTDRMNYLSAMANNVGYSQAVEELLGLELPRRAQYIRVLMAELARISDHIVCLGLSAMDLGAFSQFLYTFAQRELMYDIFEEVSGSRLTTTYTRIGGLMHDLPPHFDKRVKRALVNVRNAIDEMETLLSGNEIWKGRTQGTGVVDAQTALDYSCTGPTIRAAGIPYDIRKSRPYLAYEDFDFDIVTHTGGDVWGRYQVRKGEILQSCRIIEQALDGIPEGPINALEGKVTLPSKDDVFGSIEGLIHHFKLIMDGHGIKPEGDVYSCTESPNGELGWYIVGDGSDQPWRLRVRPPSLFHYQVVKPVCEGQLVANTVATLSSLNVIAGELDR